MLECEDMKCIRTDRHTLCIALSDLKPHTVKVQDGKSVHHVFTESQRSKAYESVDWIEVVW